MWNHSDIWGPTSLGSNWSWSPDSSTVRVGSLPGHANTTYQYATEEPSARAVETPARRSPSTELRANYAPRERTAARRRLTAVFTHGQPHDEGVEGGEERECEREPVAQPVQLVDDEHAQQREEPRVRPKLAA